MGDNGTRIHLMFSEKQHRGQINKDIQHIGNHNGPYSFNSKYYVIPLSDTLDSLHESLPYYCKLFCKTNISVSVMFN